MDEVANYFKDKEQELEKPFDQDQEDMNDTNKLHLNGPGGGSSSQIAKDDVKDFFQSKRQ